MRTWIAGAALAVVAISGCGGSGPVKPSVAACTKAYPAWFLASAANAGGSNEPAPTPAACKGLSQDQVAKIAANYLASQGS